MPLRFEIYFLIAQNIMITIFPEFLIIQTLNFQLTSLNLHSCQPQQFIGARDEMLCTIFSQLILTAEAPKHSYW